MNAAKAAYELRVLFEQKITSEYYASFKGQFGRVQVEVLSFLYDNETVRVQNLADALDIPKQHASKILARLQEQGLVARNDDPDDKRSVLFSLSEEGRALMQKHLDFSNASFEERFSKLSQQEQEALLSAMEITTACLKEL